MSLLNTEHPDTGKGQARSEEKTATSSSGLTPFFLCQSYKTPYRQSGTHGMHTCGYACVQCQCREAGTAALPERPRCRQQPRHLTGQFLLDFIPSVPITNKFRNVWGAFGPCWIFFKNFKVFLKILTILRIRQLKNTHLTINTERRLLSASAGLV